MSDIVERLRIESEWYSERGDVDGERVTKEAADEIAGFCGDPDGEAAAGGGVPASEKAPARGEEAES